MAVDLSLGGVRILENFVGGLLNRIVERRPRLIAYYGHVGVFQISPPAGAQPPGQTIIVHTHTVVIGNTGGLPAHNVRVPHRGLLAGHGINVSVDPGVNYWTHILPGGQEEILFPILVSKQQVTISYLYQPPITYHVINLPIRCDEGMARQVNVLPTPQSPRWLSVIFFTLAIIGLAAVAYGAFELVRWAGARFGYF
jgi:hypothetical protein